MPESNLKIVAYDSPEGAREQHKVSEFTVVFNPETFTVNNKIDYKQIEAKGQTGGDPQFEKIPPLEFTIEFVIDGTGVSLNSMAPKEMDVPPGNESDYVRKKIRKLRDVTGSNLNGEIHRPNYLALLWGTFYIECVLTSLNIVYSLFAADGTPLRAKVSCGFLERIGPGKNGRQTRLESPDLTRYATVLEGDLLWLLSNKYYNDPGYYIQLARANKLTNFRNLKPGTRLVIPPLKDSNG